MKKITRYYILFLVLTAGLVQSGCTRQAVGVSSEKTIDIPTQIDTHDYQRVLDKCLVKGKIKFRSLQTCKPALDRFLDSLASAGPGSTPNLFTDNRQAQAFWINAHNAFALRIAGEDYNPQTKPESRKISLRRLTLTQVRIDRQQLTLSQLAERAKALSPNDPRVDLALFWPCKGRGELLPEAFTADRLDSQLNRVVQLALDNPNMVNVDHEHWKLLLAEPIYKNRPRYIEIYQQKFQTQNATMINALNMYANPSQRRRLNAAVGYPVVQLPWNASLNEQEEPECSIP